MRAHTASFLELTHLMSRSIGIQVREAGNRNQQMLPPSKPTHWIIIWSSLRICYRDGRHVLRCDGLRPTTAIIWHFQGYKCEWIFMMSPTWWETRIWFSTQPNLSSDGSNVLPCSGLQSTSVNIQYICGYKSECISLLSQLDEKPDSDSLLNPTCYQMDSMFRHASAFNQPMPSFDTSAVTSVSVYICVKSDLMRSQILISYSYATYYQMKAMFGNATAFNQPLSTFNTAKVTSVSAY